MSTVNVKRNDDAIIFTDTLLKDGLAFDLTGSSVKFLLRNGTFTFEASGTIVGDPTLGNVSAGPGLNLPDRLGDYKQEWEVTNGAGRKLTFPSADHNTVTIVQDLG